MKKVGNILAVLFIAYGLLRGVGITFIFISNDFSSYITGINIYKLPINLAGSLCAIIGGIFALYNKPKALLLIGLSIISYIIGASYEIVLEHGIYFYKHIMITYFVASAIQIVAFTILAISILKNVSANKSLSS